MVLDNILLAIEEKTKWERRQKELMQALKVVRRQKKRVLVALQHAMKWHSYYTGMMNALGPDARADVRGERAALPCSLNR